MMPLTIDISNHVLTAFIKNKYYSSFLSLFCVVCLMSRVEGQTIEEPLSTPRQGAYWEQVALSLSSNTSNANIYFTSDGAVPTSSSNLYEAPIILRESQTIRAIATANSLNDSKVVNFEFEIGEMTSVGTADPNDGKWKSMALPEVLTGTFQFSFTATPTGDLLDSIVALAPASASNYTDCAVLCGFNSAGVVVARNGSIYDAETVLNTVAGLTYTFNLDVDVTNHTYSLEVIPDGGQAVLIADDYAFRTEQSSVHQLSFLSARTLNPGSNLIKGLSYVSIPSVAHLSYTDWIADEAIASNLSRFDDDADQDGLNNILEYFIGTDPNSPSTRAPIQLTKQDGGQISVSFQKARQVSGVDYALFESTDLSSWTEVTDDLGPATYFSDPTIETFSLSSTVTPTEPTKFYQLRLTVDDNSGGDGSGNGGGESGGSDTGTGVGAEEYSVAWESSVVLPSKDDSGYSVLAPSANSRLIYVDQDGGNDSTAQHYSTSDAAIGSDHQNPTGSINAYATISAAMAQARDGQDDWVMLERGDVWVNVDEIRPKNGISRTARSVISWYGSDPDRPEVRNGVGETALFWSYTNGSNSAIMGIYFYAITRDPDNAEFVGWGSMGGNNGLGFRIQNFGNTMQSILIEDCEFAYYSNNTIQQGSSNSLTDIILRRNLIRNNYSTIAHSQGIFSNAIDGYLVEENLFYHNGWYRQQDLEGANNEKAEGQATIFNHNTYFSSSDNLIMRRNIFLASSSIHNKFTANSGIVDTINTSNVLLYDNYYAEGELAASLGGNTDNDDGPRFENIHFVANVATHIGDTRPTNRALAWGIQVEDWNGGVVQGNIFKDWGSAAVGNTYAIDILGHSSNVTIQNNTIRNIYGSSQRSLVDQRGNDTSGLTLNNNDIQVSSGSSWILEVDNTSAFTLTDNNFYSVNSSFFEINGSGLTYTAGINNLGAAGSTNIERTSYMQSLGEAATLDTLITRFRSQTALNPLGLSGKTINDYIRAGMQEQ